MNNLVLFEGKQVRRVWQIGLKAGDGVVRVISAKDYNWTG